MSIENISNLSLDKIYQNLNNRLNKSIKILKHTEIIYVNLQLLDGELVLFLKRKDGDLSWVEEVLDKNDPKSHFIQILSNNEITLDNFKL
jgi:hypothetical protein